MSETPPHCEDPVLLRSHVLQKLKMNCIKFGEATPKCIGEFKIGD